MGIDKKQLTKKISFDKGRHFEFLKEEMATYQIPSPDQMNCNGDIATNWKTFRESYEDYIVATGLDQENFKWQENFKTFTIIRR